MSKRSTRRTDSTKSSIDKKEEDSILNESLVILDFPEFHSTTIFHDSKFDQVSSDHNSGSVYQISNCSFDTLRIENLDTENPTCMINQYLPLNGTHVINGTTYLLIDRDSLDNDSSNLSKDSKHESKDRPNVWYTNKCIEFSTDI